MQTREASARKRAPVFANAQSSSSLMLGARRYSSAEMESDANSSSPQIKGRRRTFATLQNDSNSKSNQSLSSKLQETLSCNESRQRAVGVKPESQSLQGKAGRFRSSFVRNALKTAGSMNKSTETLIVNLKEPLNAAGDDRVLFGDQKKPSGRLNSHGRSLSVFSINTVGSSDAYTVPTHDHKYRIKHGLPFGTKARMQKEKSYMRLIEDRANGSVDPRKYSAIVDWGKQSTERPNLALPRAKKVTSMQELMDEKKKIPGPSNYKNMDPYKPKIFGFYGNSAERITVL